MTKAEALYGFFSGFGIPAYTENNVPDGATYPWLTYQQNIGNSGDPAVSITVSLWYRTDSEIAPMAKVEQIAQAISSGGVQLPHDSGTIWVKRGYPWCNSVTNPNDHALKQKHLNVELEYL